MFGRIEYIAKKWGRVCTHSTSAGRKYLGSTRTRTLPQVSVPTSSTPSPDHLQDNSIQ